VQANKQAISQQLESAKKNFEVGTATITDTHEAQARFDLASAQEIAAERSRSQAARAASHRWPGARPLAQLRKTAELTPPQPSSMNDWVAAESGSLNVQVQQYNASIAAREVDKQRAGHYPTIDVVANYGHSKAYNSFSRSNVETDYQNAGLQLNIPLFSGGLTASRQREPAPTGPPPNPAWKPPRAAPPLAPASTIWA
jgi:outer membrane protein